MSAAGIRDRERFAHNMQAIEVGAQLARHRRAWIVVGAKRFDTSVTLQLQHGRRSITVYVGICHTGPLLWDVGLRPVAPAPVQRELLLRAAA